MQIVNNSRAGQIKWGLVAAMGLLSLPALASAAPTYSLGQNGVFGLEEAWHWSTPSTINSADDSYAVRFSALNNQTVDSVRLRLDGGTGASTWRIGIQADNGSGSPSGTFLSSAVHTNANAISWNPLSIGGSVAMNAGSVYHVVVQPENFAGNLNVFSSSSDRSIRPYDRATDTQMNLLRNLNGGGWSDSLGVDPYFVLFNGGAALAGPGQPYVNTASTNQYTRGANGQAWGQFFAITDKEVPLGAQVQMSQIHFGVHSVSGSPDDNLLIRLRQTDGTILATAQLTPADAATGNFFDLNFDVTATLTQGVNYLMTTEFGGDGGTIDQRYNLYTKNVYSTADADATWGGQVFEPVYKSIGGSWTAWEDPGLWDRDIPFTLTGTVVPEPAAGMLLVGSLAMLARRRAH